MARVKGRSGTHTWDLQEEREGAALVWQDGRAPSSQPELSVACLWSEPVLPPSSSGGAPELGLSVFRSSCAAPSLRGACLSQDFMPPAPPPPRPRGVAQGIWMPWGSSVGGHTALFHLAFFS